MFWHQQDLRIEENLALSCACIEDSQVVPLFILSDHLKLGGASRWWLHQSLDALQKDYAKKGAKLIFHRGDPRKVFRQLNPEKVFWNKTFSEEERRVSEELGGKGRGFNGNYLIDIQNFFNKSGKPFTVFTSFYKALLREIEIVKVGKPHFKKAKEIKSESLDSFSLLPKKNWAESLELTWTPGRQGALKRLRAFNDRPYEEKRDYPAAKGTSFLSPHLHFGEISPYEVWEQVKNEAFKRQLAWREFATAFVIHFLKAKEENWKAKFDRFPWENNPEHFRMWKKGLTGYPIVDAGMRQLWKEGWMPNRVRMIVASFLVKDLFIDWKKGAAWFWDTLVDADMGNNVLGWQWVAGSGPDAAPFFRVFNPTLQGEKFDPDGVYVKTFCPELKKLPQKWIHKPWAAPEDIRLNSGINLGDHYPYPIVEHKAMREKALKAFKAKSERSV